MAESLAGEPGLGDLARWPLEARPSLWMVDGQDGNVVLLRDLQDDREIAVAVPPAALLELPKRTVVRARVVPWRGATCFFGDPGLYGQPGVLARMHLLQQWRDGVEPELLAGLHARRVTWARQRNQHRVFLAHFGSDLAEFRSGEAMQIAVRAFLDQLLNVDRGIDGTGPTLRERFLTEHGRLPQQVDVVVGETLLTGSPALCFDPREGLLFFPGFGELKAHLAGTAENPDILALWMSTSELPVQGLARAGLSVEDLAPVRAARPAHSEPSCFPEFEPHDG